MDALDAAAHALASCRYAIALVGAGISVESGIPPFRGAGGLWTKHGEPPMDGYQRFMLDPAQGWRDMLARRARDDEFSRAVNAARPNPAHHALARLEQIGVLQHMITQNVDDLHFVAGSSAVTEIHGNRTKVRCVDCGDRWAWDEFVALHAQRSAGHPPTGRDAALAPGVVVEMPPYCPSCRGIVKGDTVMFGEPIPERALAECYGQAERADCCLIAGTSATVVPAAYFPQIVFQSGGTLIEVNTDDTPFSPHSIVLRGRAGDILASLAGRVSDLIQPHTSG